MITEYILTDKQLKNLLPNGCRGKYCDNCSVEYDSKLCNFLWNLV